jgi:hypothetical protein
MNYLRKWPQGFFLAVSVASMPALAADIIVSAQDRRFVRVDGRATFPQPAPSDSLQMDVERALAVYAIRDAKLVGTGERIKLGAGPVSIRSMPR